MMIGTALDVTSSVRRVPWITTSVIQIREIRYVIQVRKLTVPAHSPHRDLHTLPTETCTLSPQRPIPAHSPHRDLYMLTLPTETYACSLSTQRPIHAHSPHRDQYLHTLPTETYTCSLSPQRPAHSPHRDQYMRTLRTETYICTLSPQRPIPACSARYSIRNRDNIYHPSSLSNLFSCRLDGPRI